MMMIVIITAEGAVSLFLLLCMAPLRERFSDASCSIYSYRQQASDQSECSPVSSIFKQKRQTENTNAQLLRDRRSIGRSPS